MRADMIDLPKSNDCTGCSACYSACPTGAISMQKSTLGFFVPNIDDQRCINCRACTDACQIKTAIVENEPICSYAAYATDDGLRMSGTSGGVFGVIAEYVLSIGGVVFGAAYDSDFNVNHISVESKNELFALFGSKYSQSDLNDCFKNVKNELVGGRCVLFVGTPCQVIGLKKYLRKDFDNLLTIDIICHSIPSTYMWQEYLKYRCGVDREHSMPIEVYQRSKKTGWVNYTYCSRFVYSEKEILVPAHKDEYMRAFTKGYISNPACSHCNAKSNYRASDITLGDFWGVEKLNLSMDVQNGVSAVIIRTEKGQSAVDAVQKSIHAVSVQMGDIEKYNPALVRSCKNSYLNEKTVKKAARDGFGHINSMIERKDNIDKAKRMLLRFINRIKFGRKRSPKA